MNRSFKFLLSLIILATISLPVIGCDRYKDTGTWSQGSDHRPGVEDLLTSKLYVVYLPGGIPAISNCRKLNRKNHFGAVDSVATL